MRRIGWLLLTVLLFGGCAVQRQEPVYRVVTGVEVEYTQDGKIICRTYNRQESMRSVLNYLRLLEGGTVAVPPESSESCKFTLRYSHGPDTVILQRGTGYLQRNGGLWQRVDSNQGQLLYPLLLLLPSDG